jgi:hypothetical protein
MFSVTINISVLPERLYKITGPAGVNGFYSNKQVLGSGVAYFIANKNTSLVLQSATAITGSVTVTEVLRSYYNAYDGQGGVWAYVPSLDRYTSMYSYRPECISLVANRLVTFDNGLPYVHNSSTYNSFYSTSYDSVVAMVHNDAGASTKVYSDFSVEGNTPDLVHCRTEVPYVQSSDLRGGVFNPQTLAAGEFSRKEGVNYADILRDRLSPNNTGTYEEKLFTGDKMRGENGLFQGVFFVPSTGRYINFVNIGFVPSRGHDTQNSQ